MSQINWNEPIEKWLDTTCKDADNCITCNGKCGDGVRKESEGHWYITIGHPGFNSPANNGFGYKTEEKALSALQRYASK